MTLVPPILAVDFHNTLIWAVFIGWILSVILHEFAHGIVAYFGGDYTIRERGGLTLNPIQYIDPVFSILFPAIIFLMGGVPLPGGVTYIRRDLLRNRFWQVATSAAGPAMNFLIFLALALPFHQKFGWITPDLNENSHLFMGTLAWLEMLAVLYNLVPVPPLDGFQIIEHFLTPDAHDKIRSMGTTLFFIFFLIIWKVPGAGQLFHHGVMNTLEWLGFDFDRINFFIDCFNNLIVGK